MIKKLKLIYELPLCEVSPLLAEGIICLSQGTENIIDDLSPSEYEWK